MFAQFDNIKELNRIIKTIIENNQSENKNELLITSLDFVLSHSMFIKNGTDLNLIYHGITNNELNKEIFNGFINSACLNIFSNFVDNNMHIYQKDDVVYENRLTYYDAFEEPFENDRKGLYYLFPMWFFDYIFSENSIYKDFEEITKNYKLSLTELNDVKRVIVGWTISEEPFENLIKFFNSHPYLKVAAVMYVINNVIDSEKNNSTANGITTYYHEGYIMVVLIKLMKTFGYENVIIKSKIIPNNVVIDYNYKELIKKRLNIVFKQKPKTKDEYEPTDLEELLQELKFNNSIEFPRIYESRYKNYCTLFNYLVLSNRKRELNLLIYFNKIEMEVLSPFVFKNKHLFITIETFKQILSLKMYSDKEICFMLSENRSIDPQLKIWYDKMRI